MEDFRPVVNDGVVDDVEFQVVSPLRHPGQVLGVSERSQSLVHFLGGLGNVLLNRKGQLCHHFIDVVFACQGIGCLAFAAIFTFGIPVLRGFFFTCTVIHKEGHPRSLSRNLYNGYFVEENDVQIEYMITIN